MKKTNFKGYDGEDRWKKKEPGARLSKNTNKLQEKSQIERDQMEDKALMRVKVIFVQKWTLSGFVTPELFTGFKVKLPLPLSREEILEKMETGFAVEDPK